MKTKIGLGCDHAGLDLKIEIKKYLLEDMNYDVVDFGTDSHDSCDAQSFAEITAMALINNEISYGVLICGTGVGMSIAANKVSGVRAVLCSEPFTAKLSKEHNNTNILCFGARVVGVGMAKMIVQTWLSAEFEGGRHVRRDKLISDIEKRNFTRCAEEGGK